MDYDRVLGAVGKELGKGNMPTARGKDARLTWTKTSENAHKIQKDYPVLVVSRAARTRAQRVFREHGMIFAPQTG